MRIKLNIIAFVCIFPSLVMAEEFKEGKHYLSIPQTTKSAKTQEEPSTAINVTEFFTFMCPGCFQLEKGIVKWKKNISKDITFIRVPVSMSSKPLQYQAKGYYVAEHFNKGQEYTTAIFTKNQVDRSPILTKEEVIALLVSIGIKKEEASDIMDSYTLEIQITNNEELAVSSKIFEIPTVVVNNKYRISPNTAGGFDKIWKIVDFLIKKDNKEKGGN